MTFSVFDAEKRRRYQISTGRELPVNPQGKGALRSLRGVVQVEEV